MATIIERGSSYLARVRLHGFKPVSKTFHQKRDAAAWAKQVEAAMQGGRWVEAAASVPTLNDAVQTYKAAIEGRLKGHATYAPWLDELGAVEFAVKPLDKVTPADLSNWRDQMTAQGLKPGTIARKLGLASGLYTWAMKDKGWLQANPMHMVRKPRVNDARVRVATPDELAYIQRAAASSRAAWLADVLTVLVNSAMRRSEVWGLKTEDVDFGAAVAHLADTKNGTARDVPLCPASLEALQRLKARATKREELARDDDDAVRKGHLVPVSDPHAVSLAFRRTLARARRSYEAECVSRSVEADKGFLVGLRLHDFRHSAVTAWASTGALTLPELAAVSGHKSTRMLMRYVNLSSSDLARKLAHVAGQVAAGAPV